MPFQRKIDQAAWPSYCIAYNELKQSVYDLLRPDSTSVYPEREFQDLLQVELDKINLFAMIKYEDIFRSLQSVAHGCSREGRSFSDGIEGKEYFLRLEESIDKISKEIVNLDGYVRTNCEGLMKLISKFDKILGSNASNWFVAKLCKEDFCNVNFSSLYILLSLTWSKYRACQLAGGPSLAETTWRPPESFVRSTSKYWVKPESVAQLKSDVLKHLPYLIFGSSLKDQEQFLDPTSIAMSSSEKPTETQLITSIYFDNVRRDIYRQRILRKEGARLLRFRWYGSNEGSPDQEIFVERKVHHESWFDEASSKDRFSVKQKEVFSFMKGQRITSIDWINNKLALEVNKLILELELQPFIRTCYHRCAFQLASSNDVRISLDTQMSLINEFQPNFHPNAPWCRLASDVLAESDLVRFPFAILEVKLADASGPPSWVNQMLENCGAVRVHKFSKFLHAMAFLHPDRISMLPHWFPDFQQQAPAPAEEVLGPMQPSIENILLSQSSEDTTTRSPAPSEMRIIEPKSLFANERTFIHYAQKCSFLLAVGLATSNSILGIAIALASAGYLFVVFSEYGKRKKNISLVRKRSDGSVKRLDVSNAPYIAAVMVMVGSLLSFFYST